MTRYQLHVEKWKNCTACDLSKGRYRTVLCRGSLPCDVVFVGEAPGDSEDTLGEPFVGQAGQLLDRIVAKSVGVVGLRWAMTNLVCCKPPDKEGGGKEEPLPEEISACSPRLIELLLMANPKLIVCVGTTARDYLDQKYRRAVQLPGMLSRVPQVFMKHPAAMLRMNIAQKGMEIQRAVVALCDAMYEVFEAKEENDAKGG